jgi:hypothetical protein
MILLKEKDARLKFLAIEFPQKKAYLKFGGGREVGVTMEPWMMDENMIG